MKKNICILFILLVLATSLFADKSRFYENEKVIDTMYVNSDEELRVRDYPSLKSNRLCGLTYRMPVKVVAIGKEETIDDITAPWLEILIPPYEWKNNEPEYGWVFGGYLSEELPKYIEPKNAHEFRQYLESSYWKFWFEDGDGALVYIGCFENGNVYIYEKTVDAKRKKILTSFEAVGKKTFSSRGYSWFEKPNVYADYNVEQFLFVPGKTQLDCIDENSMYVPRSAYPEKLFVWDFAASRVFPGKVDMGFGEYFKFSSDIKDKRLYAVIEGQNILQNYIAEKIDTKENISQFIKVGISAKGTEYEKQYHDYWNPIMKEHQKKADKMIYGR